MFFFFSVVCVCVLFLFLFVFRGFSMWKNREGTGSHSLPWEDRANSFRISFRITHGTFLNSLWGEDIATFLA